MLDVPKELVALVDRKIDEVRRLPDPYGIPQVKGWIPVAGADMPDVETNPGPKWWPVIPAVVAAGLLVYAGWRKLST